MHYRTTKTNRQSSDHHSKLKWNLVSMYRILGTLSSGRNDAIQVSLAGHNADQATTMSLDEVARRWLRRLVTRALDVEPAVFDQLLTGTKSTDNQAEPSDLVQLFFSTKAEAGSVLFFYKGEEQYELEEEVEEEVEVTREASPIGQSQKG
ncbi:hypothetical protein ON010_g13353 [Phytophthora cinnamomi]|nr:hypothetical protein ON010_g13353 [Phytophthora cinnamomi]